MEGQGLLIISNLFELEHGIGFFQESILMILICLSVDLVG